MLSSLVDLSTPAALDEFLATSAQRAVLIYKHSMTCGTSAYAFEEVQDVMNTVPDLSVGFVRVQAARAVSNEIARRFDVRHESPQALLIQGGVVVWRASHYGVTAPAIAAALGASRRESSPVGRKP